MSNSSNFLTRWSKRKQEVQNSDSQPAPATAGEEPEPQEPGPADPELSASGPDSLPSIEDITADSNLSAFLRQGIPPALRNAALRRAWSLDPAIRDFASPAEYDWDFNAPGAMAGFGAVGAADTPERLLAMANSLQSNASGLEEEGGVFGSPPQGPASAETNPAQRDGKPPAVGASVPANGVTLPNPEPVVEPASEADRPRPRHGSARPV